MQDFSERRIRLVYYITISSTVFVFFCAVLTHILNLNSVRNAFIVSFLLFPVLAYLSKKGKLSITRPLFLITTNIALSLLCLQTGKSGSAEYMLMITIGLPFFIYSYRREKVKLIGFSCVPFILWAIIFINDFNLFNLKQLEPERAYELIYPLSTLSTILFVLVLLTYYFKLNSRYASSVSSERDLALEESNLKSDFLSTMSHEIRTPLNAIVGLSHILADNNPRKDQEENIGALNYSSKLLMSLLNNVLDLSKLKSSNIKLDENATDLQEAIRQIEKVHEGSCLRKGITMNLKIDKDIPIVLIDIVRFNQVINNLISNAIKFTEKGEVTLRISKSEEFEEKVILLTEVIDSGIGIPEDKQETIWEDYAQASSATSTNYGGTGLGLPIVKSIINAMGSQVYLESKMNEGSKFYFSLELTKSFKHQLNLKENLSHYELAGKRILLVEDNHYNVLVGKQILEKENAVVEVATNGLEAVEIFRNGKFDIILMDIQMPIMNGYEASLKIKTIDKDIPILALTASVYWENEKVSHKNRFDGYVMKPFNPEDLFHKIQVILAGSNKY